MLERTHAKDGRTLIPGDGCALGHRIQAKECPACCESLGGTTSPEWWAWFAKRYPKHKAAIAALKAGKNQ